MRIVDIWGVVIGLEGHQVLGSLCESLLAAGCREGDVVCNGTPFEDVSKVDGG